MHTKLDMCACTQSYTRVLVHHLGALEPSECYNLLNSEIHNQMQ